MTRTAASLATGPFGHDWPSVAVKHLAVFQSGSAIDGEEIEDFGTYPVYGGNGLRGYTEPRAMSSGSSAPPDTSRS